MLEISSSSAKPFPAGRLQLSVHSQGYERPYSIHQQSGYSPAIRDGGGGSEGIREAVVPDSKGIGVAGTLVGEYGVMGRGGACGNATLSPGVWVVSMESWAVSSRGQPPHYGLHITNTGNILVYRINRL